MRARSHNEAGMVTNTRGHAYNNEVNEYYTEYHNDCRIMHLFHGSRMKVI